MTRTILSISLLGRSFLNAAASGTAVRMFTRSRLVASGQNNHSAVHAKIVVKGAHVGIRSRRFEGDTKPCRRKDRTLWHARLIFQERYDRPRVNVLPRAGDSRVERAVRVGVHGAVGTA